MEPFEITEGIGLELHPDNVIPGILSQLKAAGVTRISIGGQSFLDKMWGHMRKEAFPDGMEL